MPTPRCSASAAALAVDAPFDRSTLPNASREGETGGLRWRIVAAPMAGLRQSRLVAFHLKASVAWADVQNISAETIRLGKHRHDCLSPRARLPRLSRP